MTICIGVVCEDCRKVVVAADRMVTAENLSIEFEGQASKIVNISKSCVAMTAGDALLRTEVFNAARSVINAKSLIQIPQIVDRIKDAFVEERKKRFEERNLKPRGLSLGDFYGGAQRSMDPNIAMRLDRELENAELGLHVLVAGVDENGAHLYELADPGVAQCFNSLGFCSIGSGYPHAISGLISNDFHSKVSLNQAVYLTYEAKRRAEAAPGVGKDHTDMAIIEDKVTHLSDKDLEPLSKIYAYKLGLQKPVEAENKINELPFGKE